MLGGGKLPFAFRFCRWWLLRVSFGRCGGSDIIVQSALNGFDCSLEHFSILLVEGDTEIAELLR